MTPPSQQDRAVPFRPTEADFPPLKLPADLPPTLLVVVDTEEEFDWSGPFDPANQGVANIAHQHLAQSVFAAHGVVPTYVVDYPVAASAEASATLRAFADAGACDIGAHLHPWVTPPDATRVPPQLSYPGNLPAAEEFAKLEMLTHTIQAAFGRRPTIYKAGRYGVGPATANALRTLGYQVDISLVPHTDFSADGGPDFAALGHLPVRFTQGIVGLPLSTGFAGHLAPYGPALFRHMESATARRLHLPGIAARLGLLERLRLSPEGHGFDDMLRQVRAGLRQGVRLFMLTYHSSSLLPGATPYVRDEQARAAFLATLDRFLGAFLQGCGGKTETVAAMAARLARQAA